MATPRATTYSASSGGGVYAGLDGPPAWVSSINVLQWTEIADSVAFGTWAAANTSPSSGYLSTGAPFTALVDAFSEWTMDDSTGMLYLTGGGHFDSSVNAVYSFNPSTLQYAIPVPPTPPSKYPPGYTEANGSVVYPSGLSLDYFGDASDLTAPADAAYINPEQQRRATHTYASLGFWNGRVLCHYNYFGAANTVTGRWEAVTPKNPYGPQLLANGWAYTSNYIAPQAACVVDPSTGKQYVMATGLDGDNLAPGIYRIDPTDQTVEAKFTTGVTSGGLVQDDTYVYQIWVNDDASYNQITRVKKSDGTKTFHTVTGTICPKPSGSMEVAPMCSDGTYAYLSNYGTERDALYRVNLTTFVSDKLTLTASAIPAWGLRYRLHYFPAWNVIMVLPTANSKWWALKLA